MTESQISATPGDCGASLAAGSAMCGGSCLGHVLLCLWGLAVARSGMSLSSGMTCFLDPVVGFVSGEVEGAAPHLTCFGSVIDKPGVCRRFFSQESWICHGVLAQCEEPSLNFQLFFCFAVGACLMCMSYAFGHQRVNVCLLKRGLWSTCSVCQWTPRGGKTAFGKLASDLRPPTCICYSLDSMLVHHAFAPAPFYRLLLFLLCCVRSPVS